MNIKKHQNRASRPHKDILEKKNSIASISLSISNAPRTTEKALS